MSDSNNTTLMHSLAVTEFITIKTYIVFLCRSEIWLIFKGSIIRSINLGYFSFSIPTTLLLLFSVHHFTGGELTPKAVFTALSFLTTVRFTIFHATALAVIHTTEGFVAVNRIQVSLILQAPRRVKISRSS